MIDTVITCILNILLFIDYLEVHYDEKLSI